jgi:phage terminase large subunit-like protein
VGKRKTRAVSSAPPEPARSATQDKTRGYWFDHDAADLAVEFFRECLTHVKGEKAGQALILEPWQERDIVRPLFGWKRPDGLRRYRTLYCEIPKKNGKSTLAAGLGITCLFTDDEPSAEVYSAASDREQAGIIFDVAKFMVENDEELRRRSVTHRKQITIPESRSFYRVLSSDVKTKHGLNAHMVNFDELHTQPNRDLFDTLKGAGAARRQPLHCYFTTAGYDRKSVCYEQHDYADKILRGVIKDDSFLAVIYAASEKDDWTKPATWRKANPNFGVSIKEDFLVQECKEAQEKPAYQNTFRRLYLNIWTSAESKWLPFGLWDRNSFSADDEDVKGRSCTAGLDLASTTDIAAFVRVFRPEDENGRYIVKPTLWIPADNIRARVLRDRVPYDAWARDGWIETTPGDVIDYKFIRQRINELQNETPIEEIAFDRWGATGLSTDLQEDGFLMVQFGQGFASMSAPTKELLRLLMQKRIAHGGHPVLRWMADNVMTVVDAAKNIKPDREKSIEKIDGIIALIMALDRAMKQGESIYEERGIRTV